MESLGHLERYNQQSDRETKHSVTKSFDTRNLFASPTKRSASTDVLFDQLLSDHPGSLWGSSRLWNLMHFRRPYRSDLPSTLQSQRSSAATYHCGRKQKFVELHHSRKGVG